MGVEGAPVQLGQLRELGELEALPIHELERAFQSFHLMSAAQWLHRNPDVWEVWEVEFNGLWIFSLIDRDVERLQAGQHPIRILMDFAMLPGES
jgi:hypothetical protein